MDLLVKTCVDTMIVPKSLSLSSEMWKYRPADWIVKCGKRIAIHG
jgi:hypothetical protein